MPKPAPAIWDAIERHWLLGSCSVEGLAHRYGVAQSTIRSHARVKKWAERGARRGDTELILRAQTDDLWRELNEASARLRAGGMPETPTEARDRLALIRLWQQSIAALRSFEISAQKTAKQPSPTQSVLFTKADADAVVRRLERLVARAENS